jgi:hypothetical protein
MPERVYDSIRSLVEGLGGSMVYEHEGHRFGAWVITLRDKRATIEAGGTQNFPELDRLYVPTRPDPEHWADYSQQLVPDAKRRLLDLLDVAGDLLCLPCDEPVLAELIGRTKWKFAWTYARTYPHEYTTKTICAAEDHATLIDCIERYGFVERFGTAQRKYLYFEERKYWHMGKPSSQNPEEWPNVINRTWVDVRRHADNVSHRWTPEEVELQMRLWEIQLEKTTDRPKPERAS